MKSVRPMYLPPPYQDAVEQGRVILRDGMTATIRMAQSADQPALEAFFRGLSPASRHRRFLSPAGPSAELLCDMACASESRSQRTLIVTRLSKRQPRIIAVGSYFRLDAQTAEVAMAVDEVFHGRGLGTLLLERLALLAIRHGFVRFWAMTGAENTPMLDIFRHSGFSLKEKFEHGEVEVELSVVPTEASVARSELLDRLFTAASLRPLFHPQSVAVVGASRDPSHIGARILDALVMTRFEGPVYPVNPKASVVGSIRAYPTVREIPERVDLALVVVPAPAVLEVVHECAARGVRALVVISAGFAETGEEGKRLQQQLAETVRGYGMRLVGPNCLGLINTDPAVRLNASFSPVYPPAGRVAMLSQSGALGIAILAIARAKRLGLSSFVSVGNKADVSGNDLLQYWEHDPSTDVILLYLESFGNPRRFSRIARRVSRSKPIIAVKSGRTIAGQRAAGSHTAALAASDVAVDALFHQTGVIRADTLEEMCELAAALGSQPLPKGRRVAIITNAGGPGILCADTCETGGLNVLELSEATKARLTAFLPQAASVTNPVDMIASASPDHYRQAIAAVLPADDVDLLIVIHIPVGVATPDSIIEGIRAGIRDGRAAGGRDKPVTACLMGQPEAPLLQVDDERIPTYVFPETAARVWGKGARYADYRAHPPGMFMEISDARPQPARAICQAALAARGPGWLSADETRQVLEAMQLPAAPGGVANTAEEAVARARQLGFPVAVKLASHRIVHKTDRGGVMLNLSSEHAVRDAYATIRQRLEQTGEVDAMDGVLVQPMLSGGVEVMVGVVEDPSFGPLIAFGLGGVYVEVLRDVSFRVTPLTDLDAKEMVREIRGFRLLEGYRGHPAADVEAIEEVLLRVSLLVEEVEDITEMDLNPIFALPPGDGCRIVDARIRVGLPARSRNPLGAAPPPALRHAIGTKEETHAVS